MSTHHLHILPAYHEAHANGHARYHVYYGGAGGGKSHYICQRLITRMLTEKKQRYMVVRKYYTTIKDSVYHLLLRQLEGLGLLPYLEVGKSPFSIRYPGTGSEIIFKGLDDSEKIKSIDAINSIWIEECTEIKRSEFDQLNLRLRQQQSTPQEILLSFNPVDTGNWVYSAFFAPGDLRGNAYICKTTYKDNPYLPDAYARQMEELKGRNENYYNIYALGEWGSYQGLIYKPMQLVEQMPANPSEVYYGVDFGYNNPSAVVRVAEHDGAYYIEECLYEPGLTPDELEARIKDIVGPGKHYVYCDSAEPGRIESLHRKGVLARPADKAVKDGIGWVLGHQHLIYSLPGNTNLNREATAYTWKTTKDGTALDEPEKDNDHALDALRYALYTHSKRKAKAFRVMGVK